MEGSGEVPAAPEAPATCRPADRTFGRNMYKFGPFRRSCARRRGDNRAQAGFPDRSDKRSRGTRTARSLRPRGRGGAARRGHAQGPDYAVDLGMPRVGGKEDLHAAAVCFALSVERCRIASSRFRSAQSMISIRPSACSTSAVQLSTSHRHCSRSRCRSAGSPRHGYARKRLRGLRARAQQRNHFFKTEINWTAFFTFFFRWLESDQEGARACGGPS